MFDWIAEKLLITSMLAAPISLFLAFSAICLGIVAAIVYLALLPIM